VDGRGPFRGVLTITFLVLIMARKHGLREGLMLSFFLSNLSFYNQRSRVAKKCPHDACSDLIKERE
jgi:hypothetical protein